MKKISFVIVLSFIFIGCDSCKSILLKMEHVKAPSLESGSKVQGYLKRHHLDHYAAYTCRDSASCVRLYLKFANVPETGFFNARGEMLIYSDTSCPGRASNFAASFRPGSSSYRIDPGFSLPDLEKLMVPLGSRTLYPAEQFDLTVVIFWAVFCGNINRNAFEIMDVLNKQPGIKVQFLLLNMDFLEEWGMKSMPPVSLGS